MGDDVGLSDVDGLLDSNDMLMAVMQTDMMELENTGEPAMDDFQEHFHAAVNRESGVLAFYIPSVNVVEPGVVSQLVAAIEAGDRKLRLKLATGPHPPIRGMNPIKKFCRETRMVRRRKPTVSCGIPQNTESEILQCHRPLPLCMVF